MQKLSPTLMTPALVLVELYQVIRIIVLIHNRMIIEEVTSKLEVDAIKTAKLYGWQKKLKKFAANLPVY